MTAKTTDGTGDNESPCPDDGTEPEHGAPGTDGARSNFGLFVSEQVENDIEIEVESYQCDETVAISYHAGFGSFTLESDVDAARDLASEITDAADIADSQTEVDDE